MLLLPTMLLLFTMLPLRTIMQPLFITLLLLINQLQLYIMQVRYPKITSSRLSRLVAHPSIFRLFMKEKFDAYVLW
jgi:hypothetical protein